MVDYYDRILVAIAGSVLGGIVLGVTTAMPFRVGLFVGTVVATVFVYDAMFRNPPLPATNPRVATAAIVWHAFLFVTTLIVLTG